MWPWPTRKIKTTVIQFFDHHGHILGVNYYRACFAGGRLFACGLNTHGELGVSQSMEASQQADGGHPCQELKSVAGSTGECNDASTQIDPPPCASSSRGQVCAEEDKSCSTSWHPVCLPSLLANVAVRHVACGWNHTLAALGRLCSPVLWLC